MSYYIALLHKHRKRGQPFKFEYKILL